MRGRDAEPAPEPEVTPPEPIAEMPDPAAIAPVFAIDGSNEFSRAGDVMEFEHDPAFAFSAGTLMLSFNADTVSGSRGLLSKDARDFGNGGHFTSYIKDGTLVVRVQDGSSSEVFEVDGIKADVDYDLQVNLAGGQVTAMLNGEVFGQAAVDMSWETNTEFMQIGANGWASDAGESGFTHVFDGTISDVAIFDQILTQQEFDYYTA